MNAIDFYPTNESSAATGNSGGFFSGITNAKDYWNIFLPTINISRHIKNKLLSHFQYSLSVVLKLNGKKGGIGTNCPE